MAGCEEKRRLRREFALAVEAYARAAKELQAAIQSDDTKALQEIERTRRECGGARHALQEHMLTHRC
jgi:hypothetical protein